MSQDRMDMNSESSSEAFAVFRNGRRVSDSIYPSEFFAQHELDYWVELAKKWPDGSRIEVCNIRTYAP